MYWLPYQVEKSKTSSSWSEFPHPRAIEKQVQMKRPVINCTALQGFIPSALQGFIPSAPVKVLPRHAF